jgi:hypothetical protein
LFPENSEHVVEKSIDAGSLSDGFMYTFFDPSA